MRQKITRKSPVPAREFRDDSPIQLITSFYTKTILTLSFPRGRDETRLLHNDCYFRFFPTSADSDRRPPFSAGIRGQRSSCRKFPLLHYTCCRSGPAPVFDPARFFPKTLSDLRKYPLRSLCNSVLQIPRTMERHLLAPGPRALPPAGSANFPVFPFRPPE